MSVKVAVRVRPFNQKEIDSHAELCINMVIFKYNQNGQTTIIKDDFKKEKSFSFDYSFWSHDDFVINQNGYVEPQTERYYDQQKVFNCMGKEILDNAWEGYNCCLFAYGQTGSGKSYSMVGYGANKGIVPISCEEIFDRIKSNTITDKLFEVMVSMLEIYNEKVQDLLIPINKRPSSGLKVRESK